MESETRSDDTIIEICGGGVEVKLNGPRVTPHMALKLWQSAREDIARNGIPKTEPIGAGSGFAIERAVSQENYYLGEGGPKVSDDGQPIRDIWNPFPNDVMGGSGG